ncbi:MAG: hypothetical protein SFV19_18935 [Rhodospirillaceae bacterium]|nr:hypothetical protein [Rhodospirillaceae bacterium]
MNDPREIIELANWHLSRILKAAEIAMKPRKFRAFRVIVLDEFGGKGFSRAIYTMFGVPLPVEAPIRQDKDRQGPTQSGTKGGAP